jgi:exonuclease VII large subunit
MEDNEATHAEVQRRTIEATENLHRTERSEIEALKKALSRALDELESTRAAEKDAQARSSKAILQVSMYENEIIAAKSDLKFMTETMDEMREAESSRRSSLEHRITSLQNDHNLRRRFHTSEMENLGNDTRPAWRDRLLSHQSSARRVETLLHFHQMIKWRIVIPLNWLLRVEKAQLLSACRKSS